MIGVIWRQLDENAVVAFTVYEPPNPPADRIDRAEELVFIKDGFTWAAAFFAPFWLLAKQMWLPFVGYVAVLVAVLAGLQAAGVPEIWSSLAILALHLVVGFEADSLRRWTMEQEDWQFAGSVVGRNAAECERRFFETWLPKEPMIRRESTATSPPPLPGSAVAVGMTSTAGQRQPGQPEQSFLSWLFWGPQ